MRKFLLFWMLLFVILLAWCDTPVTTVTEYIWNWTCVWQWRLREIEWYANCKRSDWWSYEWDIWGSAFNWKWKLVTSEWEIQDWYFYNWMMVAGKVTWGNGNSWKWLWGENWHVELWKFFYKSNWTIQIWEFDSNWDLSYWMNKTTSPEFWEIFYLWNFKYGFPYNWYITTSQGCSIAINWNISEVTRTITNTVYKNVGINWLNRLNQLGSKLNPYNVNVTIK